MERVVGILGGMGPEATAVFLHRLVQLTPASRDQEHLKIVVVNNPKIPDRTAHITGNGASPVPALVETAADLQRLGADFIVIPCNTAHYFWDEIQRAVSIPVLNIISETALRIAGELAGGSRIGILATRATTSLGLYQEALRSHGLEGVAPDEIHQKEVTRAIACIKELGDHRQAATCLERSLAHLKECGVGAAIYGCTELGLAQAQTDLPVFDSLEILARATVDVGRGLRTPRAGLQDPVRELLLD